MPFYLVVSEKRLILYSIIYRQLTLTTSIVMNKSQLISAVAEQLAMSKDEVRRVVDSLLGIAERTLSNDEKVLISGFGMFSVVRTPEPIGRNPRTGEKVKVDERRNVRFKSSMNLK